MSAEKLKLKIVNKSNLPRKKFAEIFREESNEEQDGGYIDDHSSE